MDVTDIEQLEVRLVSLKLPINVSGDLLLGQLVKMACISRTPFKDEKGRLIVGTDVKGYRICGMARISPNLCYFLATNFFVHGLGFATCCKYLKIAHAEIRFQKSPEGILEAVIERRQFDAF